MPKQKPKPLPSDPPTRDPFAAPVGADLAYIEPDLRRLAVRCDSCHRDTRNFKQHGPADLAVIAASLGRWKFLQPAVIQRSTRRIVIGNGRHEALAAGYIPEECAGLPPAEREQHRRPCEYFPAVVKDLTDAEADRLAFEDNATGVMAEWDTDRLLERLPEIQQWMTDNTSQSLIDNLFTSLDLDGLLHPPDPEPDPAPAAAEATATKARRPVLLVHTVTATCANEAKQIELFERLRAEGFDVKVSTTNVKDE